MAHYFIGDVHGQLVKLTDLLIKANLIDGTQRWIGGGAHLWFLGDFFDRGPYGVDVVDLIMRLQVQAADAGGEIRALLGNHEILFLGAHRFSHVRRFMLNWKRNGGQDTDMALITSQQLDWLRSLPAMALVQNHLLMHADAMFYLDYGSSIDEVNHTFSELLHGDAQDDWNQLLDDFADRMAFWSPPSEGIANAMEYLSLFGGEQIIHGHTPIQYLSDIANPPMPLIYGNKLCVDVDGGMYLGAPGFVYRLPG